MTLRLVKDAGKTLKRQNGALFTNIINYLRQFITPGLLEIANHTTDEIREGKIPTTVTKVRSFLGLCNVFRRFVTNFTRISSPLPRRLNKTQAKDLGLLRKTSLRL